MDGNIHMARGDRSTAMTIVLPALQAVPLMRALPRADGCCSPTCDDVLAPVRRFEAAIMHTMIEEGRDGISARLAVASDATLLACEVVDGLALTVRARAPIYVTHGALNHAGVKGEWCRRAGRLAPATTLEIILVITLPSIYRRNIGVPRVAISDRVIVSRRPRRSTSASARAGHVSEMA